jgi:riboflavin kinase / FMN adenylyltransferase
LKSCFTLKNSIKSIAIGGFDGMHLAHQELFKRLCDDGAILVIETGYANLTPQNERENYTNFPIFYYLLGSIKHLTPEAFIVHLKDEYPNLEKIVIGFDFKFGINASGTIGHLQTLFKGETIVVDEFFYDGIAIHSKIIRELICKGDVAGANRLLGKNYKIKGEVKAGQGIGKTQFVPTININSDNFLLPNSGIYSSFTTICGIRYLSVTFLGHRVSTDGKFAIETHIIDKVITNTPKFVEIEFVEKIRENQKYTDMDELKIQILDDISKVKNKNKTT